MTDATATFWVQRWKRPLAPPADCAPWYASGIPMMSGTMPREPVMSRGRFALARGPLQGSQVLLKRPTSSGGAAASQAIEPASRTALGHWVDVLPSPLEPIDVGESVQNGVDGARFQTRVLGKLKAVPVPLGFAQDRAQYRKSLCR